MGITSSIAEAALGAAAKLAGSKAVIGIVVEDEVTEKLQVQFNPSEYRITNSASYSQTERRKEDEPVVNYNGAQFSKLSVKLYFNSDDFFSAAGAINSVASMVSGEEDKGVTGYIDWLTSLTKIEGQEHQPPKCIFAWGAVQFLGFAESVAVTYTMFDKSGIPTRAVVDLTMQGTNIAAGERKSPQESPDRTKARTLTEDTNIWSIARKEYGSSREWRRIADANNIMNPLDIPVGKVLRVPSIND
ncbi:MAG: hypothetical protein J6Y20_07895 [Lachnospiraceae bacterium]|jgi:hypothetical protein|nr:hypothetical protein [Lachnospiraceae bacterium]